MRTRLYSPAAVMPAAMRRISAPGRQPLVPSPGLRWSFHGPDASRGNLGPWGGRLAASLHWQSGVCWEQEMQQPTTSGGEARCRGGVGGGACLSHDAKPTAALSSCSPANFPPLQCAAAPAANALARTLSARPLKTPCEPALITLHPAEGGIAFWQRGCASGGCVRRQRRRRSGGARRPVAMSEHSNIHFTDPWTVLGVHRGASRQAWGKADAFKKVPGSRSRL